MKKIPLLFKRGVDGKVIPEINPECEWVLGIDNGLMTIKLDGICVKVYWNQYKPGDAVTNSTYGWVIARRVGEDKWVETKSNDPADAPIWTAWKNLDFKQDGIYEVYGKDINGNPHFLDNNYMIRIMPVDYSLIVARGKSKIDRGIKQSAENLYNQILEEFKESPEIEGLVFHNEDSKMNLKAAAKIRKKDFGLQWPEPKIVIDMASTNNDIPIVL